MSTLALVALAAWLGIGTWLTTDSFKVVIPRIIAEYGRINWFVLLPVIVVTVLWSPAPFFYVLVTGKR